MAVIIPHEKLPDFSVTRYKYNDFTQDSNKNTNLENIQSHLKREEAEVFLKKIDTLSNHLVMLQMRLEAMEKDNEVALKEAYQDGFLKGSSSCKHEYEQEK